MISLKNLLYAVTKVISENFEEDIFIEDNNTQGFDKSCFYVQLLPINITASTKNTNENMIIIAIEYLQEANASKANLYDVQDKLCSLFLRKIKVEDRYLSVTNIEPEILKDDVGYKLSFLITVTYHDDLGTKEPEFELMQDINIQIN